MSLNKIINQTNRIYHDEEILISYGDDYWAKHEQQAQRISYETVVEASTAKKTVPQPKNTGIKTAKKNTCIKTAKRKKKVITISDNDDSSDFFSSSEWQTEHHYISNIKLVVRFDDEQSD